MILYYAVSTLYVLVCLLLLLVILLQQGKGGDMASAFGDGSSQTAFGARAGATLLTKMTTVCAVLFMVGALVLAILAQRGPASLVSGTAAPPAAQKPATPVPAGTTPAPASTPTPATPAQAPASNPPAPQPPK
jgi:preprotein translocase subunit SecG